MNVCILYLICKVRKLSNDVCNHGLNDALDLPRAFYANKRQVAHHIREFRHALIFINQTKI